MSTTTTTPFPPRKDLVRHGPRSRAIIGRIAGAATAGRHELLDAGRSELLTESLIDFLNNVSGVDQAIRPRREQFERIAEYAAELAAAAPPLTAEQKDRLALLLQPKGGRR